MLSRPKSAPPGTISGMWAVTRISTTVPTTPPGARISKDGSARTGAPCKEACAAWTAWQVGHSGATEPDVDLQRFAIGLDRMRRAVHFQVVDNFLLEFHCST